MKRAVVSLILGVSIILLLSLAAMGFGGVKTGPLIKDRFPGASVCQIADKWCICTFKSSDLPKGTIELRVSIEDDEPHLDASDVDGNELGEVPLTCDCVPAPIVNSEYAF